MSIVTHGTSDTIDGYKPFEALHREVQHAQTPLRTAITHAYRRDEREAVRWLLTQIKNDPGSQQAAQSLARKLVETLRAERSKASGVDALMHEYSLSSDEGIALMCLAEALLRIPDHQTADRLIADKISKADWYRHIGESPSLFVNAATWGLLITGKLVGTHSEHGLASTLTKLIARTGEPLIRKSVDLAMRMLGNQFVTGETIDAALENSGEREASGYTFSYDMLGEAALTAHDAEQYYAAYQNAIHAIGRASNGKRIKNGPGISVKLSALHPRYSRAQRTRVIAELLPRLKNLFLLAKQYDLGLNIDAEEADRLELSLDLIEKLALDPDLAGFNGIGFVIQAYQKRAPFVIDYLIDLAHRSGHQIMIRLVKGAYWDTEIKRAQVDGLSGYPVYTRKMYTDLSYLACAQKLLAAAAFVYPQFATHNALSMSTIYTWAQQQGITNYEFQCLHGMGETLYDQIVGAARLGQRCRIYAPVGSHRTLLAYLVRRLLENGANSSFVNQLVDENISIDSLLADPIVNVKNMDGAPHPDIPLPIHLFGDERLNSTGLDLSNELVLCEIDQALQQFSTHQWCAKPLLFKNRVANTKAVSIFNPADHRDVVGQVIESTAEDIADALTSASEFALDWQSTSPMTRAAALISAAELFEKHRFELMALAIREAGKSLPNAIGEVREAVDFLCYYASQVQNESNVLAIGPVVCISPWNFPLSIFIGEVSAALAAGNVVLAKPAEQTPLIAYRAIQLLHQAGIPRAALQFLPGRGETVGAKLIADERTGGVVFTGSTEVARQINQTLTQRSVKESRDLVLIAETGGQNAMIIDSSALPEQVVQDVISSAFDSAGQRCSALRVLCLQEEISEKILSMLKGAMQDLCIGNPDHLAIDVGPVIDADAKSGLENYLNKMKEKAKNFFQLPVSSSIQFGTFVMPTVLEISSLSELTHEVFGPVLHVIRFKRDDLPELVNSINALNYGLTLGIHSRIDETIEFITSRAHVGNIYVNRNIIGAVVGVQPFGGENKSGTGPKAGGPLYLKRLQKNPSIQFGKHSSYEKLAPCSFELRTFTDWLSTRNLSHISTLAKRYVDDSLAGTRQNLSGPTGEQNTLSFVPRGKILCFASTQSTLLNQLAAVLATENVPILITKTIDLLPPDFPAAVRDIIEGVEKLELLEKGIQIALVERNLLSTAYPILANRSDSLISIIETDDHVEIPIWRLVVERALCINTTAAGGNARLMSHSA
ncbi:MAG TPA: bifunctional proline dehydrogenase/L-glutamate gamma-semialdehyde dehydrogenase PutA [Burkholderiaceae bacterium]|jgi:RHH-type proline utilization regulon transcriptional repressor/proline dehydrogenase/delta 1-pyrroline-5-carboxylate dehydrogenase